MATILVAEDHPDSRAMLVNLLGYQQHRLLEAADGVEALALARDHHPDLVVSDLVMPVLDGYGLVRQLRADPVIADTPVIFYSAMYEQADAVALARSCGVHQILAKPTDPEDILHAVALALNSRAPIQREPIREVVPGEGVERRNPAHSSTVAEGADSRELAQGEGFDQRHLRLLTDKLARMAGDLTAEIEERQQARQALRENERRYRRLVESSPDAIFLVRDDKIVYINQTGVQLFGATAPEQILGRSPFDILHPDHHAAVWECIQGVLESQEPARFVEQKIVRLDGTEVPIEAGMVPFEDHGATTLQFVLRDITGRKQLEAQLLHAQKLECIGQFSGGMAHDFNNLLMVILGYTDLAEMQLPPRSATRHYLDNVRIAAERAAGLTGQLLAFARKHVIALQNVDVNEILASLEKMLRPLIGEVIKVEVVSSEETVLVRADPGQLTQVLMNLAANSRDAMPAGGQLSIELSTVGSTPALVQRHPGLAAGEYALLTIRDTGVGMPDTIKAHIFEPFFTTKEPGKGTGLGLATCYGIIKQSAGVVEVESEEGCGTTFRIYLPRVVESGGTAPQHKSDLLPGGTETILVVEDEALVRGVAARMLRARGYTVLEAKHGVEAMEIVKEHPGPIDLVVTDVVMPRMGGRDLADRIRGLHPGVKVLFTSGYLRGPLDEKDPGFSFLPKPFKSRALMHRVRQMLDRDTSHPLRESERGAE